MPNPTDKKKQESTDELSGVDASLSVQESTDELSEGAVSLKTKQPSKTIIDQSVKEVFDAYMFAANVQSEFMDCAASPLFEKEDCKAKISEDFDDFIQSIFGANVSFIKPYALASIKQKHKDVIQSINSLNLTFEYNLEILAENIISIASNLLNEKTIDLLFRYDIFLQICKPVKPAEWIVLHNKLHSAEECYESEKERVARVLELFQKAEWILQDHGQIYINISLPVNAENSNQGAKYCITIKDYIDIYIEKINSDKGLLIERQIKFKNDMFRAWVQKEKDGINIPEKFDGFVELMFQDDVKLIEQDDLNEIEQKYKNIMCIINKTRFFKHVVAVLSVAQVYTLTVLHKLQQIKIKNLDNNLMYLNIEESDSKVKDSVDAQLQNFSADLPINEESKEADSVPDSACSQIVSIDELSEGAVSLKTKQPSKTIANQSAEEVFDVYECAVSAQLIFLNSMNNAFVDVARSKIKISEDFNGFMQWIFRTNVSFIKPGELVSIKQKYKKVIQSVNNFELSLRGDLKALSSYIHDMSWGWVKEKTLDLSLKYDIFLQICKPVKPEWTALHDKLHGDFESDGFKDNPTKEQIEKISPLLHEIELIFQQYYHIPIDISLLVGSSQDTKGCITIKDYINEQVKKINAEESVFIKRLTEFKNSLYIAWKDKIKTPEEFDDFIELMFQDDLGLITEDVLVSIRERYKELLGIVNSFVKLNDFEIVTNMFQFCMLRDFGELQQAKIKKLGNNLVYLDIEEPDHKAKDSVDAQLQNCSADSPINEESKEADSECSQAVQIDELSLNKAESDSKVKDSVDAQLQNFSADSPINEESKEADSVLDPAYSQTVQIDKLPSEVPSTNFSSAQEDLVCQSRRNISI